MLVEGRMQADDKGNPRIWTRQDGSAGASFEVTALTIKYLSAKNEGGAPAASGGPAAEAEPTMDDDGIPF